MLFLNKAIKIFTLYLLSSLYAIGKWIENPLGISLIEGFKIKYSGNVLWVQGVCSDFLPKRTVWTDRLGEWVYMEKPNEHHFPRQSRLTSSVVSYGGSTSPGYGVMKMITPPPWSSPGKLRTSVLPWDKHKTKPDGGTSMKHRTSTPQNHQGPQKRGKSEPRGV